MGTSCYDMHFLLLLTSQLNIARWKMSTGADSDEVQDRRGSECWERGKEKGVSFQEVTKVVVHIIPPPFFVHINHCKLTKYLEPCMSNPKFIDERLKVNYQHGVRPSWNPKEMKIRGSRKREEYCEALSLKDASTGDEKIHRLSDVSTGSEKGNRKT